MWQKYFKVVKLVPGRVDVPGYGIIDFSNENIPVEVCKELYEKDFPYLEVTELGKEKLYGLKKEVVVPEPEKKPEVPPQKKRRKRRNKTKPDTE